MQQPLGAQIPETHPNEWNQIHGVIGEISRTPVGNIAMRVGNRDRADRTWHQTAYVVLTPDEVTRLHEEIRRAIEGG